MVTLREWIILLVPTGVTEKIEARSQSLTRDAQRCTVCPLEFHLPSTGTYEWKWTRTGKL